MNAHLRILKCTVAAVFLSVMNSLPLMADEAALDRLFDKLQASDVQTAEKIEQEIWALWSQSGSATADLLLRRGRSAMADGDWKAAIEHLTALTDYAPDFAEGWNARATAYFQAKLYGPSVSDIGRVLELNPRHFGALQGLARILEELGYHAKALEALREVKRLHPMRANVDEAITRLERHVGETDL